MSVRSAVLKKVSLIVSVPFGAFTAMDFAHDKVPQVIVLLDRHSYVYA